MVRANDPPSIEASRTVTGIFFVAIIDFILLGLALLWLLFICEPAGALPAGALSTLTLLHFFHVIVAVPACVTYGIDVLYIPFYFIAASLAVAAIDVFILVSRASGLFNGNAIDLGCNFFLFLFDLAFLLFAILYLAFSARSTAWYGSLGNTEIDEDPFRTKSPPTTSTDSLAGRTLAGRTLPLDGPSTPIDSLGLGIPSTSARSAVRATHKKDDDRADDDDDTTPLLSMSTASSAAFGLPTSNDTASARRRALKSHATNAHSQ